MGVLAFVTRRRWFVLGGGGVILTYVILELTVCAIPSVTVVNDNSYDVGFRNCRDWHEVDANSITSLSPHSPCSVYRVEGHLITYLGCLRFPDKAFTSGAETAVSELDRSVSQRDCAHESGYFRHDPTRKAISQLLGWVWP